VSKQTNILVIEDDTTVREAIGHALKAEDFGVFLAGNQEEAIREFNKAEIDILLLDLHPATEDPLEIIECLTTLQSDLPVIAMTGRLEHEDLVLTLAPFDVLLGKPLDFPILIQTLKTLTTQTPGCECPL
jgi:DNA-binding response OmpR family regulator